MSVVKVTKRQQSNCDRFHNNNNNKNNIENSIQLSLIMSDSRSMIRLSWMLVCVLNLNNICWSVWRLK